MKFLQIAISLTFFVSLSSFGSGKTLEELQYFCAYGDPKIKGSTSPTSQWEKLSFSDLFFVQSINIIASNTLMNANDKDKNGNNRPLTVAAIESCQKKAKFANETLMRIHPPEVSDKK